MARTLFVVAAHVPDAWNVQLLRDTLVSVHAHHPDNLVALLVVDNASPRDGVMTALKTLEPRIRECVALRRQDTSHGMLGSWYEADAVLRAAATYSAGATGSHRPDALLRTQPTCFVRRVATDGVATVVLLQHSTQLVRPLPSLQSTCAAIALAGTVSTHGVGWLSRSSVSMRWASAKAHELGVPCAPRCTERARGGMGTSCSHWEECTAWSAVLHSVLLLSREAFARLSSFHLWPRRNSHGKLVHNSSFSRSAWRAVHGESVLTMPHAGLEILSGILVARLNEWPSPNDRCQCTTCIEKRHGFTHARARTSSASGSDDGGGNGAANRSAAVPRVAKAGIAPRVG